MNCPEIAELSFSEFGQRIGNKLSTTRLPLTGSFELTERCNLGCVHCYINQPAGDRIARRREMDTAMIGSILEQIAAAGCLKLLITGGEPLLRPDFLDIYMQAKRLGLIVTLFTNGTLLTEAIADQLAEYPPYSIEITVYGATAKTYQAITGSAAAFDRCMNANRLLRERQLPLALKSVVLKQNRHELDDIKALAAGLDLSYRFDPVMNTRLDGDQKPFSSQISIDEILMLDQADEKRAREYRRMIHDLRRRPTHPEQLYGCGAGIHSFHIDAYGQLSLCLMARQPAYDLRQGSFQEGWDTFLRQARYQKRTRATPCQTCDLSSICGQCPGMAQMQYGDAEAASPFMCELTHRRVAAFETEIGSAE
jgi:radical SAM protein with 4Fe4S-binding SPASM domain